MTAGQDMRWRREVIQRAGLPAQGNLLDLGAGTGDLARQVHRWKPGIHTVAADFTLEMMQTGRRYPASEQLCWCAADGLHLPYPKTTFDAVVSGFLLRNLSDLPECLNEQHRVLKPGGKLVCLDTSRPAKNRFTPLVGFHMHTVIPALAGLMSCDRLAYTYLYDSTENFLTADELAYLLSKAGFKEIGFRSFLFGTIAIHWGTK